MIVSSRTACANILAADRCSGGAGGAVRYFAITLIRFCPALRIRRRSLANNALAAPTRQLEHQLATVGQPTLAPILSSFPRSLVSDLRQRQPAQETGEDVSERIKALTRRP
jgi:hypothetical protein